MHVPRHPMADLAVKPCIGDPGAPVIKRRVQPLTLGGPQALAGNAQVLATLREAFSALASLHRLPVTAEVWLLGRPALPIVGPLLVTQTALSLGRPRPLGIAFAFRVSLLLGPLLVTQAALTLGRPRPLGTAFAFRVALLLGPLTGSAVLLALGGTLALPVRLLWLRLAIALHPARRTFSATSGAFRTRTAVGLGRARSIHFALGGSPAGIGRTHTGLSSARRPTSVFCSSGSFTTSRALCPCLTGGGS